MKFSGIPVDNKVTGINNIISPLETQALPSKPQKLDTLGLIFLGILYPDLKSPDGPVNHVGFIKYVSEGNRAKVAAVFTDASIVTHEKIFI